MTRRGGYLLIVVAVSLIAIVVFYGKTRVGSVAEPKASEPRTPTAAAPSHTADIHRPTKLQPPRLKVAPPSFTFVSSPRSGESEASRKTREGLVKRFDEYSKKAELTKEQQEKLKGAIAQGQIAFFLAYKRVSNQEIVNRSKNGLNDPGKVTGQNSDSPFAIAINAAKEASKNALKEGDFLSPMQTGILNAYPNSILINGTYVASRPFEINEAAYASQADRELEREVETTGMEVGNQLAKGLGAGWQEKQNERFSEFKKALEEAKRRQNQN